MSSPNCPELLAHWFHAIDVPLRDPNKDKKFQTGTSSSSINTTTSSSSSTNTLHNLSLSNSNKSYTSKQPTIWKAFSKRDSNALEAVFKAGKPGAKVPCNEDYLFEVDIDNREISPVFWPGATYEVVRATWFYLSDGKFLPCDENLAAQIEDGYRKHQAWIPRPELESTDQTNNGSEQIQEKSWPLLGKYLSQYVVYTNPTTAWLLHDDMTGKLTKTFFAKLTNGVHLGGTRLIRGYNETKRLLSKKSSEDEEKKFKGELDNLSSAGSVPREVKLEIVESEDYNNDEEEERVIDHLILVIHGIGQKLSEKMESINFVHDVNMLRKTIKTTYSTTLGPETAYKNISKNKSEFNSDRRNSGNSEKSNHKFGNGVQVLPIQWRQEIKFGMASEDENVQRDLGMPNAEEGQTTLEEITLEGVPTLRMLISDVLMDGKMNPFMIKDFT
ncbi:7708_t:CDS:2 [Funneliformis mosseae]|uniref:7708_t:CDS:1 n=1 Tax=Funneliformis mosseae TaxID=27381 RepID=A0A9N9G4J4_FUNMO|nr:7708_t:CDS:2 [Funneliformis mosseae]